jgi:hypothetical protein
MGGRSRQPMAEEPTFDEGADPFAPVDNDEEDEVADALAEELNNASREDLNRHEPEPIGQGYGSPTPMGMDASFMNPSAPAPVVGRPTTPKIWANAHLHPSVTALRVWKKQNGTPVLVGMIDKDANEEEFIQHFYEVMPKAGEGTGVFVIRPINMDGQEVREEITLPPISEYHTVLRQLRKARSGGDSGPSQYGYVPSPLAQASTDYQMKLIEHQMKLNDRRLEMTEHAAREAAERARIAFEKAAEERIELASRTAMSVESITERMMKSEAERTERALRAEEQRNQQTLGAQQGLTASLLQMQQTAAEREREAYDRRMREEESRRERERRELEDKRERDRLEYESRMERERLEWQRKYEQEKLEMAHKIERERIERDERQRREESERKMAHDARMREMELAAQRDREHAERMMQLQTQNRREEKSESIEGMIERAAKVASIFGIKPTDIVDRFLNPPETDDEDKPSAAAPIVEALGKVVAVGIEQFGQYAKAQAEMQGRAAAGPMGMPGMAPGGAMVPMGYLPHNLPQQPQAAAPQPVPVAAVQPGDAAAPVQAAVIPQSALPLAVQKNARNALRGLVKALRTSPQEKWAEVVGSAVAMEMAIYHYCKDVTIKAALVEAGADQGLIEALIAHPAVEMIPPDVPRGI